MLGDAQTVDDGRLLCPGIHPCCFPQHIRVDVADLPHLLRGIIPEDVPELFKAFRVFFDILQVGQPLLHHHVHHAVREGNVGAGADFQVNVGVLRQGYLPGINDDQPGSILHGLPYLHAHHRVCLLRVGTHQKNAVHAVGNVIDRVGHGAGTQGFCQSRHACGVTDSGAVIRVVGPEAGTDHLLDEVNVFVGRSGTGKSRERFAAEGIFQLHEPLRGKADGLLPGSLPEFPGFPVFDEGTGQPVRRMDKIKASGAPLDAQSPVVGRSVRRLAVYDSIVLHHQVHLTACGAVRTGGADFCHLPFPVLLPALQGQGPGGTGRRTIAAALAPGRFPVGPEGGFHDMEGTGTAALKSPVVGHFMAGADAGMTVDAFARVIGEIGIVLKNRHLLLNLHPGADRICLLHAVPVAEGLQPAVAVFCAAHAVQPVIGQNQLKHLSPVLHKSFCLRPDLHPFLRLCAAGGKNPVRTRYFYHAEAAGSDLIDVLSVTEGRNVDPMGLRCLQDGLALLCRYLSSVNGNVQHTPEPPSRDPHPKQSQRRHLPDSRRASSGVMPISTSSKFVCLTTGSTLRIFALPVGMQGLG